MGNTYSHLAEIMARKAHEGQIYKPDWPYIKHVERVARYFAGDDHHQAVAWLHDVAEDTEITIEFITDKFGPEIGRDVDSLTRTPGQPYGIYIQYIRENTVAKRIKIIDLTDNLSNCRELDGDIKPDYESKASRYARALQYLLKVDTLN